MQLVNAMGEASTAVVLVVYLARVRHVEAGTIALLVTAMAVSGMLGALLVGRIGDLVGHRQALRVSSVAAGLGILAAAVTGSWDKAGREPPRGTSEPRLRSDPATNAASPSPDLTIGAMMKARIHAITLGVNDLARAVRFYRILGLNSPGIVGSEYPGDQENPDGAVAMFTLDDGLILALYPRTELAKDAGVDLPRVSGSPFSIGHFVESREAVDAILVEVARAGGRVHGEAHKRPWGIYSGYFSDLDGHMWEVVHFTNSNTTAGQADT